MPGGIGMVVLVRAGAGRLLMVEAVVWLTLVDFKKGFVYEQYQISTLLLHVNRKNLKL